MSTNPEPQSISTDPPVSDPPPAPPPSDPPPSSDGPASAPTDSSAGGFERTTMGIPLEMRDKTRLIYQLEHRARYGHSTDADRALMAEAASLIRDELGLEGVPLLPNGDVKPDLPPGD